MNFTPIIVDPDLEEILVPFIEHTGQDLKVLNDAFKESDFETMKKICHRILGTAVSYGFIQLDEIVRKIQDELFQEKINKSNLEPQLELCNDHMIFIKNQFEK